jgi:hypothetical protein
MTNLIQIIDNIDIDPIKDSYFKLESNIKWNNYSLSTSNRQTSIQFKIGEDPFLSACGTITGRDNEYSQLNSLFKNTIFEELINKYSLVRTRLMWAESKSCYSIHKDKNKRVHIPLITNPHCMFLFPEHKDLIFLKEGSVYLVNTTETHTFCNFSSERRLHLVGCVDE